MEFGRCEDTTPYPLPPRFPEMTFENHSNSRGRLATQDVFHAWRVRLARNEEGHLQISAWFHVVCSMLTCHQQQSSSRIVMNSETAIVPADGRQSSDAGELLLLQARKIGRALGFNSAKPAARPPIQHPLENLTFCNGTIHQLHHGQLAGEYMALSGIEVVRKLSLKELDGERCEYRFELNMAPDVIWGLYGKSLLPDISMQFEGQVMVLTCLPACLEWSYQRAKDAIARANLWYAEEREQLISRVLARDEDRQAAKELERNRKLGLRRQFECLQL
jgi:hypothetical protein